MEKLNFSFINQLMASQLANFHTFTYFSVCLGWFHLLHRAPPVGDHGGARLPRRPADHADTRQQPVRWDREREKMGCL